MKALDECYCHGWWGRRLFYCEGCVSRIKLCTWLCRKRFLSIWATCLMSNAPLPSIPLRSCDDQTVWLMCLWILTSWSLYSSSKWTCCCSSGNVKPITSWVPAGVESGRNCRYMHELGVGWISAVLYLVAIVIDDCFNLMEWPYRSTVQFSLEQMLRRTCRSGRRPFSVQLKG